MSHNESTVDVLIIGAGPAGLMCANALAKFGINVRIVDKRPERVASGHADGVHPRTIEVFQSYGLAERLLREGTQVHLAAFYNPGLDGGIKRTVRAPDLAAPDTRYPLLTLHQGAIEAILLDSMREHGVEVSRPIIPTAIEISDDPQELTDRSSYPVKIVLKHLAGDISEVIRAKYVVGTDGAHSWVRKALGIEMEGEQTDYIWGVVDTTWDTDFPDIRNRTTIHSTHGSAMTIPRTGDKARLYVQLTGKDVVSNRRVDKEKMDVQDLLEVARKTFHPYKMEPGSIEWWSIYIISQRVASNYERKERVFIAGDACHIHSPQAGQGMNASMNDTHNLAWKIAQVIRGWSDPSILSTYEFERRKYAQDLIDFDRKLSALSSGKPWSKDSPNGVSHEKFLALKNFGRFASGIGIHYEASTITNIKYQTSAKNLIIGQRIIPQILVRAADGHPFELQDLLPSDVRFKILVFAGDISEYSQSVIVNDAAKDLDKVLRKYAGNNKLEDVFDVLSITTTPLETIEYTLLPPIMRSHWSKVLIDQKEVRGPRGGTVYLTYGISDAGAIVVVRSDGYVGAVAPLDKAEHLDEYFGGFMRCA